MTASTSSQTRHRFADIQTAPPDAILGLTEAFLADNQSRQNEPQCRGLQGRIGPDPGTPLCQRRRNIDWSRTETTKGYLPIDGLAGFEGMSESWSLVNAFDSSRVVVLQIARWYRRVRVAAGFLASQLAPLRIWTPNPTWANHTRSSRIGEFARSSRTVI